MTADKTAEMTKREPSAAAGGAKAETATRNDGAFEIFLVTTPGLESVLADEASERGFAGARAVPGGVKVRGGWPDVWRANLVLRGANRVLARIDSFEAQDFDKLARRARRVPWAKVLRPEVPVAIDVTCRQSRLFHSGAVAERIADALEQKTGIRIVKDAPITLMVRLERDICTISVDTSGELLHVRGFDKRVHRAPMRETMAALFLRQCGFRGLEPVVDPMCGSGTFVIEAAETAAGLMPGRARRFAFEDLATFDADAWLTLRAQPAAAVPAFLFHGSDRDADATTIAEANAALAGVAALTRFQTSTVTELIRPDGPPGLVIINPPYGTRLGDKDRLTALYAALGRVLKDRFKGWRVGLVTADRSLAYAAGLPFQPPEAPVAHGGLRVTLFQTPPLE
jgi:putative N6-adenine-specific DNA methylase